MNADALYQSLGRLIAAIGEPDFGAAAFALVAQAIQADHIVANLVGKNQIRGLFTVGKLPPRIANTLNQRYLERYHLLDKSLLSSWDIGKGQPVAMQFDHRLNASPIYNTFFFERAGLCDKISLISCRDDSMVCCNLYRLASTGKFGAADVQDAQALALPLTAALWHHAEKLGTSRSPARVPHKPGGPDDVQWQALQSLSTREMEVCRRLLTGASNEGVALDLAISTHTVRTLRKRIYKKLEVSSLTDLFSKYLNTISVTDGRRSR